MPRPCSKFFLRQVACLLLAGLAAANSGCLVIAAGAAGGAAVGYAYCKGKVCGAYHAAFDDTWAAVHTALAELGMQVRMENREGASGTILTRTSEGDRIRIHIDLLSSPIPAEPVLTRVCIRVATFGDRLVSERILDQVGYHLTPAALPAQTAAPPPATGVTQAGAASPPPPPAPSVSGAGASTAPPPVLPGAPEPVR